MKSVLGSHGDIFGFDSKVVAASHRSIIIIVQAKIVHWTKFLSESVEYIHYVTVNNSQK